MLRTLPQYMNIQSFFKHNNIFVANSVFKQYGLSEVNSSRAAMFECCLKNWKPVNLGNKLFERQIFR